MKIPQDNTAARTPDLPSGAGGLVKNPSCSDTTVHPHNPPRPAVRSRNGAWRAEQWGALMLAAQLGDSKAYKQLLRELDSWLRCYYERRLPRSLAEDARQEVLLGIHMKRHTYEPSRPFLPWAAAIARYKWIDHLKDTRRISTVPPGEQLVTEDRADAAVWAIALDEMLRRLKPAQARVIRLVKLLGFSVSEAACATGQSASLVKVNIHRGLKELMALAAADRNTIVAYAPSSTTGSRCELSQARTGWPKMGQGRARTMGAKAFSSTHSTKVFEEGTVRRV